MAGYENGQIEEIKDRLNIVDIIGRSVKLTKTGANYKGLCPFHNEKTPSFIVSEQKQRYICFGCGASGDVFEFMQKYHNMDFVQALEKLADEAGVELKREYGKNSEKKETILEMNRQAARYFYKALRESENPGLGYMYERGLDRDTLRTFGIGWADEKWDSLYLHLKSLGYTEDQMLEAGLISKSKDRYFDKFRGRVIFPIQNTSGKVIGFGGRVLGQGEPKYLNSQESIAFSKKHNLYALNITRQSINKEDACILVEGYMDVIGLYQAGIRNVTASLGTALTEQQARMIKRYTQNAVLAYDADEAGERATLRGMDILRDAGCRVSILRVEGGKDPDEFVKNYGKSAFSELVDQALPFAEYKFENIKKRCDMSTTEGRLEFLKQAVAVLRRLDPVEADMYITKLARENDVSEGAIRRELGKNAGEAKSKREKSGETAKEISLLEKNLIKVMITDSSYICRENDAADLFKTPMGRGIFESIKACYTSGEEVDMKQLEDQLDDAELSVLDEIEKNIHLGGQTEEIYVDCVKNLRKERLIIKERDLIESLSMADESENDDAIRRMMEELIETQKELRE